MEVIYPNEWPCFFTATISEWKPLLEPAKSKDIIIHSLQFLVAEKRINLNSFVIMNNHIHIIWQPINGQTFQKIQQSFMKYTAQMIKFDFIKNDPTKLEEYRVNSDDREYRFWKRRSLSIELFSPAVFKQKLEYIHQNPVKAGICKYAEDYYYSSAKFYHSGIDDFNMLTHWL